MSHCITPALHCLFYKLCCCLLNRIVSCYPIPGCSLPPAQYNHAKDKGIRSVQYLSTQYTPLRPLPTVATCRITMKPSTVLLCLAPTVALAQQSQPQQPSAVQPSPSVPNVTPPVPLPELQQHLNQQSTESRQEAGLDVAAAQPTDGSLFGLGKTTTTKSLQARSEGTLGQSPWIGMAIGLTCTALAAVMLG